MGSKMTENKKARILRLAIGSAFNAALDQVDASLVGKCNWFISDESVAVLRTDEDGSLYLMPTGKPGSVAVSVHGDSNQYFPNGVTGSLEFEFEENDPVVLGFSDIDSIFLEVEEVVPVESVQASGAIHSL
jgi:hypothetical protein